MTDPEPAGTLVEGIDIDAVHSSVAGSPGVSGLGGGTMNSLTTYLPGRRIAGIRITPDSIELEVVAAWGASAADIGAAIRSRLKSVAPGRRIDVTIADIELPEQDDDPKPQPVAVPASKLGPVPVRAELPPDPIRPAGAARPESEL